MKFYKNLALLLVFVLVVTMSPFNALADVSSDSEQTSTTVTTDENGTGADDNNGGNENTGETTDPTDPTEPAHEHSYTSEVTKTANCVDEGELTWTCDNADGNCDRVTYTEPIGVDAANHKSVTTRDENVVDAACTAAGSKTVVTYCSACNEEITKEENVEIPAAGHKYGSVKCSLENQKHNVYCINTGCDAYISENCTFYSYELIESAENREDGIATVRSSCVCGRYEDLKINKELCTHKLIGLEEISAVPATCSATGLTAGEKCKVCGEIITAQIETVKLAHTEVKREENVVPATCSAVGSKDVVTYCSVCEEILGTETVEIAKLDHTLVEIPAVPATCSATGLTAGEKCKVCDEIITAQTETEKLPHTPEIIPVKGATCSETGLTAGEKCSVCGEILTAQTATPQIPHTSVKKNEKQPSCTEAGYTGDEVCSVCGVTLKLGEIINPTGHSWGTSKCNNCGLAPKIIARQTDNSRVYNEDSFVLGDEYDVLTLRITVDNPKGDPIEVTTSGCVNAVYDSVSSTVSIHTTKYYAANSMADNSVTISLKNTPISLKVNIDCGLKSIKCNTAVKFYTLNAKTKTVNLSCTENYYNGNSHKISFKNLPISTKKAGKKSIKFSYYGENVTYNYFVFDNQFKLSTPKAKKIQVKLNKTSNVTGYQIQYATDSKFKKNKKTVNVKGYKTTSKTISKLSAKKKYYVRFRAYTTVNGKNVYSDWSKTKSVKTK